MIGIAATVSLVAPAPPPAAPPAGAGSAEPVLAGALFSDSPPDFLEQLESSASAAVAQIQDRARRRMGPPGVTSSEKARSVTKPGRSVPRVPPLPRIAHRARERWLLSDRARRRLLISLMISIFCDVQSLDRTGRLTIPSRR